MSTALTLCDPNAGIVSAEVAGGRLYLFLNNNWKALDEGRLRILKHLESEQLSDPVVNRLELIFEEVVSNVMRHGLSGEPDRPILVICSVSNGTIDLVFEDEGTPFDPLGVPAPEPFQSLESAKIGGLGVHLVKKLSSAVQYQRILPGESVRRVGDRQFCPSNRLMLSIAKF